METPRKQSNALPILSFMASLAIFSTMLKILFHLFPTFFRRPHMEDIFVLVSFPIWLFLWSLLLRGWKKRKARYLRWQRQQCVECAYDLRAHLAANISPNCPECGTPIPAQSATIADTRSPHDHSRPNQT